MKINDILKDRFGLVTDILAYAPQAKDELFSVLTQEDIDELMIRLDKLADKAEEIFTASQPKEDYGEMPTTGGFEYDDSTKIITCRECEVVCTLDRSGNGARCQMGYQAAAIIREQFPED